MGIRQLSSASAVTGSKSNKFWNQSTYVGDFVQIASAVVTSGGTSTITFSGIPQTFSHLQLRASTRSTYTTTSYGYSNSLYINFNGSSSAYSYHVLYGTGAAGGASIGGGSQSYLYAMDTSNDAATANVYYANVMDILDYSSTNKFKTVRNFGGADYNTTAYNSEIGLFSGVWTQTAAISSITIIPPNGHKEFSRFDLYGVR